MAEGSTGSSTADGGVGRRVCDVCRDEREHSFLYEKEGFPIDRCCECGLVSTRVPPGFDAGGLYDQDYYEGGKRDSYAAYGLSGPVLRAEFRRVLEAMARFESPGGRLLEVGCAYGFFLDEAQSSYDVHGVEISEAAVARCREKGLDVVRGGIEKLDQPDESFDAAVLLDCIEHLPRPYEAVQRIHRLLKPGGLLVMTTGDFDSGLARLTGRRWRLMTPPGHLYFYTPDSLGRMLERSGYEVLDIAHPTKIVPVGLAVHLLTSRLGLGTRWIQPLCRIGVPLNLFDVMRVVARRV